MVHAVAMELSYLVRTHGRFGKRLVKSLRYACELRYRSKALAPGSKAQNTLQRSAKK